MTRWAVLDESKGAVVAAKVSVASSLPARLVGLLCRSGIGADEGLFIKPCSSIHTFFMRFAIDVVFVGRDMRVVAIYSDVRPWRLAIPWRGAWAALELAAGAASWANVELCDKLALKPTSPS